MSDGRKLLVFDGQVFQTPAWHRGMGKYSMELVAALDRYNQKHRQWQEIRVILSAKLPTESSVFSTLKSVAPGVKTDTLNVRPNDFSKLVIDDNRVVVTGYFEKLKSKFGAASIDYCVLSLMQSEIAPAFPALPYVHNALLFYDVIPLMSHDVYLADRLHRHTYLTKLAELIQADTYLTISKTVANDLAVFVGVDNSRIRNIDGGPIQHSRTGKALDIPKPFILMPTGNDLRKNNRRAIKAFAKFNKEHGNAYHMAVTSVFQDAEKAELQKLSNQVVFTGTVSGPEMEYLYGNADVLFFPPEYEGLGLPILEALEKRKPVACSNISVFREISETAFQYFDPLDIDDMAKVLGECVAGKGTPEKECVRILAKYTWDKVAATTAKAFAGGKPEYKAGGGPKLALVTPDPATTLIGQTVQLQFAEMSKAASPHYYVGSREPGRPEQRLNYLSYAAPTKNITRLNGDTMSGYDEALFMIGNTPGCAEVLLAALAVPGTLFLYDDDLSGLWKSAAESGLISKSRLAAEEKLGRAYECQGMLVTLLANQNRVIVYDLGVKAAALHTLKKISKDIPVHLWEYPTANLPHADIFTQGRQLNGIIKSQVAESARQKLGDSSVDVSGQQEMTDFNLMKELIRLNTMMLPENQGRMEYFYASSGALRYGAVPLAAQQSAKAADVKNVKVTKYPITSTEEFADKGGRQKWLPGYNAHLAAEHSLRKHVAKITGLAVKPVKRAGN